MIRGFAAARRDVAEGPPAPAWPCYAVRAVTHRRPLAFARLCAPLVTGFGLLAGCNAVFGIEEGELTAGAGGASSSSATSGGGSGGGGGNAGPCQPHGGARTGDLRWAHGSNGGSSARSRAAAFGMQNDVVVAGTYSEGPITFGTTTLPPPSPESVFVATFDADTGTALLARGFSGTAGLEVFDVAIAPDGVMAIGGVYENSLAVGETFVQQPGGPDGFVFTLSPTGDVLDAWNLGTLGETLVTSLAFDSAGALYVAALGTGVLDLGSGPVGSADVNGVYLFKLNRETGLAEWGRVFESSYYGGYYAGVATAPTGEVYLTGPATMNAYQSYDPFHGATDVAVVKLDTDGVILWSRLFGGDPGPPATDGASWGTAVTVLCDGDVVVTGAFWGELRFDERLALSGSDSNEDPYARADIFVARLRGDDGTAVWAQAYHDEGPQLSRSVSADASGDILVSGILIDEVGSTGIDFGLGVHPPSLDDGGAYREDFFVLKLDADGLTRWSKRLRNEPSGEWIQEGEAVLRADGRVGFGGDFYFSIDLDETPQGHLSNVGRDMFVGTFEP
jgi:hypothetical protein